MAGTLTLIPTPIDEESPLESIAKQEILKACESGNALFLVEDAKPGRRRWLRFGLPREEIESFILYNEHTRKDLCHEMIQELKNGKDLFLMSDGGLPAFCDPGRELVNLCHKNKICVTATPFPNSVVLALALSGFIHDTFLFRGFLPAKTDARDEAYRDLKKENRTIILMDTPYRLAKVLNEVEEYFTEREVFLALNLNSSEEDLRQGRVKDIKKSLKTQKGEFILIIDSI